MPGEVCLAFAHFEEVKGTFVTSLVDLCRHDAYHGQHIGPRVSQQTSSAGLVGALNNIAAMFLDETDAEWIFWLDADMGFAKDTVDALLADADPTERPCVSALAFKCEQYATDGMGGYLTRPVPVIMRWGAGEDGAQGFRCQLRYPENALVQCQATGTACVLIHRSVYERIRAEYGDVWHTPVKAPPECPDEWFTPDLSLWSRCGALGIPLFVHTGVHTTHQKTTWVSHAAYEAAIGDGWRLDEPPPGMVADTPPSRAERRRLAKASR